jgi:hypothetical protein
MKKLLLSLFTFLGLVSSAQTLTYANHAPAWGNAPFQTSQCDSIGITPGASGPSSVWNFTPTNLHSAQSYTTSNTLPGVAEYPVANVSVYSSTANIAYYHSDANELKYFGGLLSIGGVDVKLAFNTPSIYAQYPMLLNSTTTSIPDGTITISSLLTGTFSGNASATAVGTGTLNLPLKSFTDVVRVKTIQNLNATLSFGLGSLSTITDDYYSPSASKAPIFSIQTSTISSTIGGTSSQTIVTVQPNYDIVSINENKIENIQLSVFPNPAINSINFATTSTEATNVVAYDISGKTVSSDAIESGKAKMNTSNFTSGIYMYRVVGKYNQVLTTGKFTVSK